MVKLTNKSPTMSETYIDYKNKKVYLNRIHSPKKFYEYFLLMTLPYFFFYMILIAFPFLIFISIFMEYYYGIEPTSYHMKLVAVVGLFFTAFMILFHSIGGKYSDRFYAKINAFRPKKEIIINKIRTKDFIFYPQAFKNVALKYNLTGDFSEFLDNMDIIKINKDKIKGWCQYWAINFKFNKIPKEGEIRLSYF